MTIFVMSQNKIQRDSELGRIVIEPGALRGGELEAWYPVFGSSQDSGAKLIGAMTGGSGGASSNEHNGDIKLRIKYEEKVVLSPDQYQELHDVFRSYTNDLIYDLAQVSPDLESISSLLLNIFDAQGLAIPWLQWMIHEEVHRTENMMVLFRGNSVLTKSMDCYMKGTLFGLVWFDLVWSVVVLGLLGQSAAWTISRIPLAKPSRRSANIKCFAR